MALMLNRTTRPTAIAPIGTTYQPKATTTLITVTRGQEQEITPMMLTTMVVDNKYRQVRKVVSITLTVTAIKLMFLSDDFRESRSNRAAFFFFDNVKKCNMSKTPKNHGKQWSSQDIKQLGKLADQNTPTRVIGLKMGRTENSVRSAASKNDISLKPTNQSPYNRRKK
jgi:hypothetical protein